MSCLCFKPSWAKLSLVASIASITWCLVVCAMDRPLSNTSHQPGIGYVATWDGEDCFFEESFCITRGKGLLRRLQALEWLCIISMAVSIGSLVLYACLTSARRQYCLIGHIVCVVILALTFLGLRLEINNETVQSANFFYLGAFGVVLSGIAAAIELKTVKSAYGVLD